MFSWNVHAFITGRTETTDVDREEEIAWSFRLISIDSTHPQGVCHPTYTLI